MKRSKAYFINGGAGRVICSIPAFEKLLETEKDFIIICEGGMDFYKGHPELHSRAYDNWHKGLFEEHIKHRDIVSPEPYRVWEYYNQKCNLSQAFDILINNQGVRLLPAPRIFLNKTEISTAYNVIKEVKEKTGFNKVLVIQPFGRGIQNTGDLLIDSSSRSMHLTNVIEIINELKKEYAVIVMNEFPIALEEEPSNRYPVAMPEIPDLRIWAGIIEIADHFFGCDSVGQHIAKSFNKSATVVTGATYPINVSYVEDKNFDIIDLGKDKRIYDPIRISMEDHVNRLNDTLMEMDKFQIQNLLQIIRKRLGPSTKVKKISSLASQNNSSKEQSKAMFSTAKGVLTPLKQGNS